MRKHKLVVSFVVMILCIAGLILVFPGCGNGDDGSSDKNESGGPEFVTAYQAAEYTKAKATKWQNENWVIKIKEGDPDGINRQGKGRIWEVYYFSPRPEEKAQYLIQYNRGNIYLAPPTGVRGGTGGVEIYRKNKPEKFRVDSPEAYQVAIKNGGGDFIEKHTDVIVHVELRCKADYEAAGDQMPAPKYKWIWDVYFKEPVPNAEVFHVLVDGMNGEFITTETEKPVGQ